MSEHHFIHYGKADKIVQMQAGGENLQMHVSTDERRALQRDRIADSAVENYPRA